jgi:hypothetical protein
MRGKAGKKTEFGVTISISDDNGFVEVDRISWGNYNEANDLIERAKQYKQERGYHPARFCADVIYMTVENKKFCREHGIRLSGRTRKKEIGDLTVQSTEQQELFKLDMSKRFVIEGRIGTSKRKFGLDRILTKLIDTSKSVIRMVSFMISSEKNFALVAPFIGPACICVHSDYVFIRS